MGAVLSIESSAPLRWDRICSFYGLSCAGAVLCGVGARQSEHNLTKTCCAIGMMMSPLLATIATQRRHGDAFCEATGTRRGNLLSRWGLASLLTPVAFHASALLVSLAIPQVRWAPGETLLSALQAAGGSAEQEAQLQQACLGSPASLIVKNLANAMIAGGIINVLPAFGEEAGWRGLLLKELSPLGFWQASLLSGAMWGLWHAPLTIQGHNYPQHPCLGIAMMTGFCTLLSPGMTFLRWRSRSIWSSAIFHGVLNGGGGMSILLLAGGSDLTVGITGLAGLSILACANAALYWHVGGEVYPELEDAKVSSN